MTVPDRIMVAGGNAMLGGKQPPPEIALDLHTLPPVRSFQKTLETPPAKLTLQERMFPTIGDDEEVPDFRVRSSSIGHNGNLDSSKTDHRRGSLDKIIQADGLPSSSTLSLLTPAEELLLLRGHVRKLTTRVQKLEEDVQDLNTHVGWIEGLGGALLLVLVLKKLKSLFWNNV